MKLIRRSLILLFFLASITSAESAIGQTYLQNGNRYVRTLAAGQWAHFYVNVDGTDVEANFVLSGFYGNPDIYVRKDQQPTLTQWDFRPYYSGGPQINSYSLASSFEAVTINDQSTPALGNGNYYVSVRARSNTSFFVIGNVVESGTSSRPGMGATLYEQGSTNEGATFRVWAPNADSVHVAGDFNGWNSLASKLTNEGNGTWSVDFRGAIPGQRYQYVIRNGGQTLWRMDPREQEVTNSVGDSVIAEQDFAWTDNGFSMPSWNELIIYEMHIGTFNDVVGGQPGDFDDAVARLDHLQDLGINCVELMPVSEFPGDFSWGYNSGHPYSVESIYGGPVAMKNFVNEAHARGIAVLLDVVHNHYGPNDMDLWRFDGWSEGDFGGIYFYQDERSFTDWGDTRPDFGRGEVRSYIRDNAIMWLEEYHVDGFRWDSTLNMRRTDLGDNPDGWSLLQWINNEIDAIRPGAFCTAEDMQNNAWITKTTGEGGAGFDSQWNAQFVHPIRGAIEAPNDDSRNMWEVKAAVEQRYNSDAFERIIFTESHDEVANGRSRVPEEIFPGNAGSWFSQKRSTIGGALVMTSPGVPMIFQGQEVLEDGFFQDEDPIDWTKEVTFAGIELMYRDLIRLRRNWFNNTRGLKGQHLNFFHTNNGDKMVAFHRWDQGGSGDDVIVICNFKDQTWNNYRIGLPGSGIWKVRFNSDWDGYSNDFGNFYTPDVTAENTPYDGMPHSGIVKIAPYSVVILSQD